MMLLKQEASRNPVEARQAELRRRLLSLEQSKQQLLVFGIKAKAFQHIVAKLKKRLPAEAPPFEADLNQLKQLHAQLQQKYQMEEASLREFKASPLTRPLRAAR